MAASVLFKASRLPWWKSFAASRRSTAQPSLRSSATVGGVVCSRHGSTGLMLSRMEITEQHLIRTAGDCLFSVPTASPLTVAFTQQSSMSSSQVRHDPQPL